MYIAVINFCANLNVYKYVCNDVGVVYNVEVYCSPSFQVLIVLVTHKSLLKMMTSSDTKYSERDSNPQPSVSKTDALPLSHPSTFQMELIVTPIITYITIKISQLLSTILLDYYDFANK